MEKKRLIRKEMLARRKALTDEQASKLSAQICKKILSMDRYQQASCLLAYMPVQKEVSVLPVLSQALAAGKEVYLPVTEGKNMWFYRLRAFSSLTEGAFHIPEPPRAEPLLRRDGLILTPGVAFSTGCMRLGYGGGYYDRFFAQLQKTPHSFYTLAPAYGLQLLQEADAACLWEPTDQPVDAVLTENKLMIHR